jgi:hypothetical protein
MTRWSSMVIYELLFIITSTHRSVMRLSVSPRRGGVSVTASKPSNAAQVQPERFSVGIDHWQCLFEGSLWYCLSNSYGSCIHAFMYYAGDSYSRLLRTDSIDSIGEAGFERFEPRTAQGPARLTNNSPMT